MVWVGEEYGPCIFWILEMLGELELSIPICRIMGFLVGNALEYTNLATIS